MTEFQEGYAAGYDDAISEHLEEIGELRAALANAIAQADRLWACADGKNELCKHISPEHREMVTDGADAERV